MYDLFDHESPSSSIGIVQHSKDFSTTVFLTTVTQCVPAFLLPVSPQYLTFQKQRVLLGQLDRMQLFRFYKLIDILP